MTLKRTIVQWGGGWPDSIGNAFIDFGSMTAISKAAEDSKVLLSSNFPRSYLARGFASNRTRILDGAINDKVENLFDIREFINSDFVILSGEILSEYWFKLCVAKSFFKKKNVRIIIHGGGGTCYSEEEFTAVRRVLKKLNIYAFISRDEHVFKEYQGIAEHSLNGIDCAFFINDYFVSAKLNLPPYVTFTFDKSNEPKLANEKRLIIRTHHAYWSQSSFLKRFRYYNKENFGKSNTIISDLPQDYLLVYSNTEETHSDRVHACIPTLAFGKPARLYAETPRTALFDKINSVSITEKLTCPDIKKIEKEKARQVKFLSEILNK